MKQDPIADLVHRYADAIVHRDEQQWAATWAADAVWELGEGRRIEGLDTILQLWNTTMDGFAAVVQNVLNGTYEVDEASGTGTGRWYIIEHWQRANDARGVMLAYYDDEYVLTDDGWCFARRELVAQYAGPPNLTADFFHRRP